MSKMKKLCAVLLGVLLLMNCFATPVAFADDACDHNWVEQYENVVAATETVSGSAEVVKTCSKCGDVVHETVRYSYPVFGWLEELSGILVASFSIEGESSPYTMFASEENSAYAAYVQTFFHHYVTEDCHSVLTATFRFFGAEYTYEEEGAHRVMYFGNYPQTRVDDEALLAELEAAEKKWISYGYYVGTGNADGLMEQTDIMEYADLFLNGEKFRAVKINEHRPTSTRESLSSANQTIIQEAFGYHKNTTYYFRFEPVSWSVLDEDSGLVLSDMLLDAQSYQSFILLQNSTAYANADCTVLANSYRESTVRAWLNEDFYNTAFTSSQKAQILTTELEDGLTDKIFLLSADDVVNTAYGFNASGTAEDELRAGALRETDYALSQGLCCYPVGTNFNWWIRSMPEIYGTYTAAGYAGTVDDKGAYSGYTPDWVNIGVRPAMRVETVRHDRTLHEHTYGAPVWTWNDDLSEATAVFTCPDDGHVETRTAYLADGTITVETDELGNKTYTATVTAPGGDPCSDEKEVAAPMHVHTYEFDRFEWTEIVENGKVTDYDTTVTVVLKCAEDGDEITVAVTADVDRGEVQCLTAYSDVYTVVYEGHTEQKTVTFPAAGHVWGPWTVVREATFEEDGLERRTCGRCGETEERTIVWKGVAAREIQFVVSFPMHYVTYGRGDDTYVFSENTPVLYWYTNVPLRFRIDPYTTWNVTGYIVAANGHALRPDADGVYTIPVGTERVVVTCDPTTAPAVIDEIRCPYCGNIHPDTVWGFLIGMMHQIFAIFKSLGR